MGTEGLPKTHEAVSVCGSVIYMPIRSQSVPASSVTYGNSSAATWINFRGDEPEGGAGVREPRRPLPITPSTAVAAAA